VAIWNVDFGVKIYIGEMEFGIWGSRGDEEDFDKTRAHWSLVTVERDCGECRLNRFLNEVLAALATRRADAVCLRSPFGIRPSTM
jgi:hypothetical protein